MTNSDDTDGNSFGARFGRLVRSYRDDLGLSVRDLAVQVWEDEGRKASISRLENGHVANPAARTIQRLAHALDIPQAEIDALREPAVSLPGGLDSLSHARRDQLEALASRFEIERVFERSDAELRALLDEKALEFRAYKRRLDEIDEHLRALADVKLAAKAAAARLDFAEYDALLRQVDEGYSRMAVRAKEARARNALLRGRAEEAFAGFVSAAETWRTLDPVASAESRLEYHRALYENGLRYGGQGLALSAEILRPALELEGLPAPRRARVLQNLANALANLGLRAEDATSVTLLDDAIAAYTEAASLVSAHEEGDIWGMIQQNLGAALSLRAKECEAAAERRAFLGRAVDAYDAALQLRPRDSKPLEWAMTTQNLAVALLERATEMEGQNSIVMLKRAEALLEETLQVRSRATAPFEWALTQENLGIVAKALAECSEPQAAAAHLATAEAYVAGALEVYATEGDTYFHIKASKLAQDIARAKAGLQSMGGAA